MKAGQFTNEQIVAILQEAEKGAKSVIDLCKEKGISDATFYTWRRNSAAYKQGKFNGCANWKRGSSGK